MRISSIGSLYFLFDNDKKIAYWRNEAEWAYDWIQCQWFKCSSVEEMEKHFQVIYIRTPLGKHGDALHRIEDGNGILLGEYYEHVGTFADFRMAGCPAIHCNSVDDFKAHFGVKEKIVTFKKELYGRRLRHDAIYDGKCLGFFFEDSLYAQDHRTHIEFKCSSVEDFKKYFTKEKKKTMGITFVKNVIDGRWRHAALQGEKYIGSWYEGAGFAWDWDEQCSFKCTSIETFKAHFKGEAVKQKLKIPDCLLPAPDEEQTASIAQSMIEEKYQKSCAAKTNGFFTLFYPNGMNSSHRLFMPVFELLKQELKEKNLVAKLDGIFIKVTPL